MNTNPRQLQLLDEVRLRQSITVEQLAETLGVTLQTVRRDVQRLAEQGLGIFPLEDDSHFDAPQRPSSDPRRRS